MVTLCCITEIFSTLIIGTFATHLQHHTEELVKTKYYPGLAEENLTLSSHTNHRQHAFVVR